MVKKPRRGFRLVTVGCAATCGRMMPSTHLYLEEVAEIMKNFKENHSLQRSVIFIAKEVPEKFFTT